MNERITDAESSQDAQPPSLHLSKVSRSFGAMRVFQDLNLEIARGEFLAVVGPSGCGKSTLLNLLSGFDEPTSGTIVRHGKTRMVFQQDGLFPWLTAQENIALGLRHITDETVRQNQIQELLTLMKLESFGAFYPHQLSGGMRQRVEIARALAGETDILLLDEPFSALDYLTRLRLRSEFMRLLTEVPRTVVFVTHDIEEAAHMADRVVVLSERPARICCELRLSTQRPRDLTDPAVVEAVKRIMDEMGLRDDMEPAAQNTVK
jgi:ABC-type nitrate/sulfonate/bicarbonate transport system ATPase subunit